MVFFKTIHNLAVVLLIAGVFSILYPIYNFLLDLFKDCSKDEAVEANKDIDYSEFRHKFLTEYDRVNPIEMLEANQEYMHFIRGTSFFI